MQSDILERIRVLEADIEKRRDAVVEQQLLPISNPRLSLVRDRFVAEQTGHLADTATQLLDLYLDGDELPAIQDEVMPLEAMMSFFNARVANIREYYRTHNHADTDGDVGAEEVVVIEPDVEALIENGVFHPAEKYGTRLMLEPHHGAFESFLVKCSAHQEVLKVAKALRDAFAHTDSFIFNPTSALAKTPQALKLLKGDRYLPFVKALRDYLVGFYERVRPLGKPYLKQQLQQAAVGFDEYWRQVEAAFVANGGEEAAAKNAAAATGPNRFQAAPIPRNQPYLIAPWDMRTVPSAADRALAKEAALLEAEVAVMAMPNNGLLAALIRTSAEGLQADRSKTLKERTREEEEAEEAFLDALEQMEERVTVMRTKTAPKMGDGDTFDLDLLTVNAGDNANNANGGGSSTILSGDTSAAALADRVELLENKALLDADGNALPSWQVKLEGRRKTFMCEVCAGAIYHGPKEWREHFRFARHTEGLRRLGIINTHAYDGIHTILGAQQLSTQLSEHGASKLLKRIREEAMWMEIEDESGMVLRRGDYENMRRQMVRY